MIDYASYKKAVTKNWSLGVWTSQLGTSGTASISRILSGDRIPGEKLTKTLIADLKMSAIEGEYFKRLVNRERYYHANTFSSEPLMVLRNAWNIGLFGSVNPDKVSRLIERYGLEPVVRNGIVAAAFNINTYPDSTVGAFNEHHFCFTAGITGGGILDTGLYFHGIDYDRADIVEAQRAGFDVALGNSSIQVEKSSQEIQAKIDEKIVFKLSRSDRASARIDERYEISAYIPQISGSAFQMRYTIDTLGYEMPFDPARDQFLLNLDLETHRRMEDLDFKPLKWLIHENLFALIGPPKPIVRLNTY